MTSGASQLIRDDHKQVKGLFRQFEAIDLRAPEMKAGVIREIFMELEIHARLEEEIFYAELSKEAQNGRFPADILGHLEQYQADHHSVVQSINELRQLAPTDPSFNAKMIDLIESVEQHVEGEEKFLLYVFDRALSERDAELGQRMLALKKTLLADPKYKDAKPEIVQNPNGGEQQRRSA